MKNNANAVGRRLIQKANAASPNLRATAQQAARELTDLSRGILRDQVYAIPEKTARTGRKLWQRTGELVGEEHFEADGVHVRHVNESGHAGPRYAYGTPQSRRQPVAKPPQQISHWYTDAIRKYFPRLMALRREAIRRSLAVGGSGPAPQEND